MEQFLKITNNLVQCYNGFDSSEKEQAEETCRPYVDQLTSLAENKMTPSHLLIEKWCLHYSNNDLT